MKSEGVKVASLLLYLQLNQFEIRIIYHLFHRGLQDRGMLNFLNSPCQAMSIVSCQAVSVKWGSICVTMLLCKFSKVVTSKVTAYIRDTVY